MAPAPAQNRFVLRRPIPRKRHGAGAGCRVRNPHLPYGGGGHRRTSTASPLSASTATTRALRCGNFQYPRKRYFDEIVRVFERAPPAVPLFNDKYLAYDWADAQVPCTTACASCASRSLCGSTLPLTWRRPALDLAARRRFDEFLAVSYSDLEEHAYHGIELLQSVAERRKGGETGVAQVRYARRRRGVDSDLARDARRRLTSPCQSAASGSAARSRKRS